MKIRFLAEAKAEFADVVAQYEDVRPGLGRSFSEEVQRRIRLIAAQPGLFAIRENGYRRVNLRWFPYYLAYEAAGDTVWVLAVAHERRGPAYWKDRRQRGS